MGPSTGQSGSERVGVGSPAFAAQPSSSHSSGTRPSNSQLRLVGDEALAAAEANLPSFAQRQRQQQLEQQQPQQAADQGMARDSSQQATSYDAEVDHLGPSATAGAAHEAADAGLQANSAGVPNCVASLAGESGQHLQAPGATEATAAAAAADASAANPMAKQPALHAAVLADSATTPAAVEVVAEAAPGASAPLGSSTAAAAAPAAAAPDGEQPADSQAAAPDTSLPVPDPVRNFTLTLDLRTFQAGRRLPVALGSIYVTAWLPQELIGVLYPT